MSSIAVATLGMFQDCQFRHQGGTGGTLMRVDEAKPKPTVRLLKITSKWDDNVVIKSAVMVEAKIVDEDKVTKKKTIC